ITGGAGRIGSATARRFVDEGAKVALGDLNHEAAERLAAEIGGNALAIAFDAGDPASIEAMVNRAAEHFGRLDILHNNAALLDLAFLQRDGTVLDTPLELWDRTMQINVRGYVVACKHAIPHLRAVGGGSIINTSSTEAEVGNTARIAYACSKGAICTLTRYIATQHGREGIRCNTIMP